MKDLERFKEENFASMSDENERISPSKERFIADNGSLIACRNEEFIYLVQRGQRHLIPTSDVYNALFVDCQLIQFIEKKQLDSIPLGDPLSENACLIKGNQSAHIYLYSNEMKSRIRSARDFDLAGFDWQKIQNLDQSEVDSIMAVRDFIVERNKEVIIQADEIPDKYDTSNSYGFLTQFTCECKERRVTCHVLLPAEKCDKEYPVLYLYHGLGINSEWVHDWQGRINQIIGNMVSNNLISEMIIVMPDLMYSGEETRAYDFYRFKCSLKEVMSYVEKNYKIKKGRENTAIAGLSFGGTTTLYNAYLFGDLFQYIGAFCPTSILLYEPSKGIIDSWIPKEDKFVLGTDAELFTFIANGATDCSAGETPKFYSEVLRKNGTDNVFALLPGASHNWDTFKKLFYIFMSFDFFRKR